MSKRTKSLTQGPIKKQLIQLTLPMMIGIVSMVAFNLVDTYFVGKLGETELAALSFTFPVVTFIFSLVQGIGIGSTAIIAKAIGREDFTRAKFETTAAILLSLGLAFLFLVIGLSTIKPVFTLLGASEEVLPLVKEYMQVWYIAISFVVVPFVGNSAIRATGDTKTPALIMIFAVIINAVLDPLLIFGYGIIPAFGLQGAAMATAVSRGMTLILAILVLYHREKLLTFKPIPWAQLKVYWQDILYIGVPTGISRMLTPLAVGIVTAMIAQYGEYAVAAFGVGSRLEFLSMSMLFALSASIGPFSGQNSGVKKFGRIKTALKYAAIFSVSWGLFSAIILNVFNEPVAKVFSDSERVIEVLLVYLAIVPLGYGFQGITHVINTNLNTLKKPLVASSLIVFQMFVLMIPFAFLGRHFYGLNGIFIGIAAAYILGGITSFFANKWMLAKLEE